MLSLMACFAQILRFWDVWANVLMLDLAGSSTCWSTDGFELGGGDGAMIWAMFDAGRGYALSVKTENGVDMGGVWFVPLRFPV